MHGLIQDTESAAHDTRMTKNMTFARRRGFVLGLSLFVVGIAAAGTRFVTLDATTNSLFFISLFATAAGAGAMARVIYLNRERKAGALA